MAKPPSAKMKRAQYEAGLFADGLARGREDAQLGRKSELAWELGYTHPFGRGYRAGYAMELDEQKKRSKR